MTNRILGVLGGMGPQASIRFYELLIQISIEKYGVKSNADFPHILLNNIPVPDLVVSQDDEEKGVCMVEEEARRLARAGATVLAMPCNTMHLYAERYKRAAGLPLLSIIEAVLEHVRQDGCKRIALLGSVTTMRSNLYTHPLRESGIDVFLPSENEQQQLGSIIHAVIAGRASQTEEDALHAIVTHLANAGCEAVILGCTELPLVATYISLPLPVYDSLKILALRCCKYLFTPASSPTQMSLC